jgi:hypothetical protein
VEELRKAGALLDEKQWLDVRHIIIIIGKVVGSFC